MYKYILQPNLIILILFPKLWYFIKSDFSASTLEYNSLECNFQVEFIEEFFRDLYTENADGRGYLYLGMSSMYFRIRGGTFYFYIFLLSSFRNENNNFGSRKVTAAFCVQVAFLIPQRILSNSPL